MTSHEFGIIILVSHELRNGDDERMRLNIEAERARKGYTKQQICRELNITGKTYNSYIHEGNIPSAVLIKMHELFDCSIDYLLEATDEQTA